MSSNETRPYCECGELADGTLADGTPLCEPCADSKRLHQQQRMCEIRRTGCSGLADLRRADGQYACRWCEQREQPRPHTPRPGGSRGAPPAVRKRVLARDQHRCQLRYGVCIGDATEVDHKINVATILANGGTRKMADSMSNLAAVCRPCHAIKTANEQRAGSAAANRQRAADRRARLSRPSKPHPGDD